MFAGANLTSVENATNAADCLFETRTISGRRANINKNVLA